VNLILWHGYLLSGTGSNIYTQHVARAWARLGHDVRVLCQEPHPERFSLGPGVRVIRPEAGPLLPTFVLDRYQGIEARLVGDFSDAELERYLDLNASALAAELEREPADLVMANHAIMGGPVAQRGCAASETPYAVKLHGSELEYAIRGSRRLADLARGPLDSAHAVFAGSQHIVDVTRELLGTGPYRDRVAIVSPGVDVDAFRPDGGSWAVLFELLRSDRPGAQPERHPDADAADRLECVGPFILYFGKLLRQKGVHLLLDAWRRLAPRHPDTSLVVVGFGSERAWLESLAGERVIFTGAMDHAQLQQLVPCAELVVVPSVLPEAFGMVAAEAASCGRLRPLRAGRGGGRPGAGFAHVRRLRRRPGTRRRRRPGHARSRPGCDRPARPGAGLRPLELGADRRPPDLRRTAQRGGGTTPRQLKRRFVTPIRTPVPGEPDPRR
jgi:glycosyltransferase involved in cell wall biosynthesis